MSETIDIKKEEVNEPQIVVLKFADSKIPVFKESRNKDYIKYGEDNLYPEYLTYLFNKSAKHNAIINGKANYIFGKGYENGNIIINQLGETLNDISKKAILDSRIYGGFRWEIIWNKRGVISEIYHADYTTLRKGKDGGYWYKENWKPECREEEIFIESFDPANPIGRQIFDCNEYRPGVRFYPLPDYIGCLNYVETDIEISKFHLSAIRNGMAPSKMIQFFVGEPTDEAKRNIEKRLAQKYTGAENAGRFFLVFNQANAAKSVEINDLSASDLDKQFDILNKTCQQEIFSGHLVTTPKLFGITTEGQLGGNTEMQTGYAIFKNTYSEPKANDFDREVNYLLSFSNWKNEYKLQPTDPVGVQFNAQDIIDSLPKAYVFGELGIPEDQWDLPTVGGGSGTQGMSDEGNVNTHLKNLTAKQLQGIQRTVKKYKNPEDPMTYEQAKSILVSGFNLTDDQIVAFLGAPPQQMRSQFNSEDEIIGLFDSFGESKKDFEILKSKKVFRAEDTLNDETIFRQEAFKTYDVTANENKIIELIRKDKRITVDVIATTIGESKKYVESKIKSLVERGYIESTIETIGTDEIINRVIPQDDITAPPSRADINPTQIYIKYSYEGPEDSRNRPFCARLLELNRLYSRAEIETISQRLGYSVFDRSGGFWTQPDGTVSPKCRNSWKSNIVVKKGGTK